MHKTRHLIPLFLLLAAFTSKAEADDSRICENALVKVSASEQVPMALLEGVGLTETGQRGLLHPYALNIEGRTVILDTKEAALAEFEKARRSGKRLIDLGCLQVNHHYHGMHFASPADMLDPEKNIIYAARLLKSLKEQSGDWTRAVALYHASPRKSAEQRRYVCAVIRNMVQSKFGAWTPESRAYCRRTS